MNYVLNVRRTQTERQVARSGNIIHTYVCPVGFDGFSTEFTDFLEKCFLKQAPFIILGEVNFNNNRFRLLFDTFSLKHHVTEPAHLAGHC